MILAAACLVLHEPVAALVIPHVQRSSTGKTPLEERQGRAHSSRRDRGQVGVQLDASIEVDARRRAGTPRGMRPVTATMQQTTPHRTRTRATA